MIMARQMSKPVADAVMRYGKGHPLFRDRILVPIGRGLVNMSTRLRMKSLGLGKPDSLAPVSEASALEQASEFVQQVVLFGYSLGVFAAYYHYSKANEKEVVLADDYRRLLEDLDQRFDRLEQKMERLEGEQNTTVVGSVTNRLFGSSAPPRKPNAAVKEVRKDQVIVHSIPFDQALKQVSPRPPPATRRAVQQPEDQSD